MNISLLKKIGFSDKIAHIYLAILKLGPTSVRKLAEVSGYNRGTTYDALKWLQNEGLVNFFHQDTKQYFVSEDPDALHQMVRRRSEELDTVGNELLRIIPELKSLYDAGGERPIARYYEGPSGLRTILADVLDTVERAREKMYRVYSAIKIRKSLYESFESFTQERIARKIKVKVISLGEGGELKGLDQRRWLSKYNENSQTYIFLFEGKTAYISLNTASQPVGVVIENRGIYQTQKEIFDNLWEKLK